MTNVLVIGAGVLGLSCAVRLAEAGHRVDLLARDLSLETVSNHALGVWQRPRLHPHQRELGWAAESYRFWSDAAPVGVAWVAGTEISADAHPWWARAIVPQWDVTLDGSTRRISFAAPVVDPPAYLTGLRKRLEELDGTVTRLPVRSLGQHVVVNCAGLGARGLADDQDLVALRGRVVELESDFKGWLHAPEQGLTVIGDGRTTRVGAWIDSPTTVAQWGRDWQVEPEPRVVGRILEHATALLPVLSAAPVRRALPLVTAFSASVGGSSRGAVTRDPVRSNVLHCYGLGVAGFTVSWGCAGDVVALVGQL